MQPPGQVQRGSRGSGEGSGRLEQAPGQVQHKEKVPAEVLGGFGAGANKVP